ncbi:MAG: adenylate cyclase [Acidobacteriota bacterium]|nr:adenylate cyclase [Acidobacteriota bacterium]MDE3191232.1 adenylate cyclase [Acidobacteriota bacterium]
MRLLALATVAAAFGLTAAGGLAASNPSGTGQPSQTCLSAAAPTEPGNAANATGSAFNESGPGRAGTVYAGNGVSATTAGSPNAVAQYDVACYQVSQR